MWNLNNSEIRSINLIYQATKNGWECSDYYDTVLNYNNTVTFFNLRNNCVIGVLVRLKWSQLGSNKWEDTVLPFFLGNSKHNNKKSICY